MSDWNEAIQKMSAESLARGTVVSPRVDIPDDVFRAALNCLPEGGPYDHELAVSISKAILQDREDRPFATATLAGEQWCVFENGHQRSSWQPEGFGDKAGWVKFAESDPRHEVRTRKVYAAPTVAEMASASTPSPSEVEATEARLFEEHARGEAK